MYLFWAGIALLSIRALIINLRGLPSVTVDDLRSDWKHRVLPGWIDVLGALLVLANFVLSDPVDPLRAQSVGYGLLLGCILLLGQVMLRAQLLAMVVLWRGARREEVPGTPDKGAAPEQHMRPD